MKFVIHHHLTVPDHYDLMIEKGDALLTWRILSREFTKFLRGLPVHAERIRDHRKDYLDYEGPVSCDRGRIEVYDSGEYAGDASDSVIFLPINGTILKGTLSIKEIRENTCMAQITLIQGRDQ